MNKANRSITDFFKEGKEIDEAINKATREAVQQHQALKHAVVSWQNGQVVWLSQPEIKD